MSQNHLRRLTDIRDLPPRPFPLSEETHVVVQDLRAGHLRDPDARPATYRVSLRDLATYLLETVETSELVGAGGGLAPIIVGQIPAGTIDSMNADFVLQSVPIVTTGRRVFLNGLRQLPVVGAPANGEYGLAAATITLGTVPDPGDVVVVDYINAMAAGAIFEEEPTGAIDGGNTAFTLAAAPVFASSSALYHNGLRLKHVAGAPGLDEYRIVGSDLTVGRAPETGDWLLIDYLTDAAALMVLGEIPAGTLDSLNQDYTLANLPSRPRGVAVTHAGLRSTYVAGVPGNGEYNVAGTLVTHTPAPDAGDTLYVDYELAA